MKILSFRNEKGSERKRLLQLYGQPFIFRSVFLPVLQPILSVLQRIGIGLERYRFRGIAIGPIPWHSHQPFDEL